MTKKKTTGKKRLENGTLITTAKAIGGAAGKIAAIVRNVVTRYPNPLSDERQIEPKRPRKKASVKSKKAIKVTPKKTGKRARVPRPAGK